MKNLIKVLQLLLDSLIWQKRLTVNYKILLDELYNCGIRDLQRQKIYGC